ncbi:uncharacterized protein LOC112458144 [Temnothorax curvispinosus]|uniref:Uncharacterized protein LOC112451699 isoform X2 n=1 Tax=Temnothorax curvispinosus TaxID=300111 RepID=A0A6J1PCN2_9HYME|nr:uncharacterized protein LOC112451699 isoform X2 [Temnothorax curvispinosus]XP_024877356.1 uncharacterized protein LOC112458144 [Temnothorax curvispinosus]
MTEAMLPSIKTRQNILAQEGQVSRKESEQTEGIQYQSNCGENIQNTNLSPDNIKFVFFDLETSGFHKSADILQIAAKCEEYKFCAYATPTQPIMPKATEITGLKIVAGELFLDDERVQSSPLQKVLHTLVPLKKLYPQRKGKGMFKLSTLAQDLLQIELTENFHEAAYDVEILEQIASTIPKENLIGNHKSFKESLDHETRLQKTAKLKRSLNIFKNVISNGMIKKIAEAGINRAKLQDIYEKSGREGIIQLLSAKQKDNKPRVTNQKRILENIVEFLDTNQSPAMV